MSVDQGVIRKPPSARKRLKLKTVLPYILIFPAIFMVIWILGISVIESFILSLQRFPFFITGVPEFVGIQNYLDLFRSEVFQSSVRISLIFVGGSIALGMLISLGFALALYRLVKSRRYFSAFALLPYLISGVAIGTMWRFLFSGDVGLINMILRSIGQSGVAWFSDPTWALVIIIFANAWGRSPVSTMVMLSGLQSIDPEIYDAAKIDGCTSLKTLWHVTLPQIKPQFGFSLIWLNFVAFSMFDIVLAMTRGGPGRSTEVLAVRMYYLAFEHFDVPGGAAILIMLLLANIIVSAVVLKYFKV